LALLFFWQKNIIAKAARKMLVKLTAAWVDVVETLQPTSRSYAAGIVVSSTANKILGLDSSAIACAGIA